MTYNSRTIRALEAALSGPLKITTILAVSTPEAGLSQFTSGTRAPIYGELFARQKFTDIRSAISSAVLLLWGATSELATTHITGRAREIFWEKRIVHKTSQNICIFIVFGRFCRNMFNSEGGQNPPKAEKLAKS